MKKIIKLAITRPTVVVVLFAALLLFGLFSYNSLNKELFPPMSYPMMTVGTVYPGGGSQEVESSVTKPMEDALASLEGVKTISSVSMEGFSNIIVEFHMGTDIDMILQDAQRRINAIMGQLPAEVKTPSVSKFNVSDLPILNIGVTSSLPPTEFYDYVKNEVKSRIEQIKGVAKVQLLGGSKREIQVNLREDRLKAYGLSILQVSQTLIASNLDFPTGKVKDDNQQVMIRLSGKYNSIQDIENVILTSTADGTQVRVKDIAEVLDSQKETETINRLDGATSLGIQILRQSDANTVEVSQKVKDILKDVEQTNTDKALAFSVAMDESEFTNEAASSVMHDLIIAILLVAVTMFLFLHSFRDSLIVILSIPTSLIATFIAMKLFGFTLNMMSLLALSLVVGILVDDAIVVIENIHRHLEMGKKKAQAAYDGLKEIGPTIVSITLVIAVVFIPIALTNTMRSDVLRQFSVTIAAAVLLSLLVSFTLVPLLSSRMGKLEHINTKSWWGKLIQGFENGLDIFAKKIAALVNWSFSHKLAVFGITLALFFGSFTLVSSGLIGNEFLNMGDRGEFFIVIELPKDSPIEKTNGVAYQAENIVRSSPLVESVFTTVGSLDNGQPQPYMTELFVKMVPYNQRKVTATDLSRDIKMVLQQNIVGAKIRTAESAITGGKNEAPIGIYVQGNNLEAIISTADMIRERISEIPGIIDAKTSVESGTPEISIHPDRAKMAALGIPFEILGASLANAFSGNQDAKFKQGNNEWDINIRLDRFDRKSIEDVRNFSLTNIRGELVRLSQFATVEESDGISQLNRRNRMSSVTVSSQVVGRPVGTVGKEIQDIVAQIEVPDGVSIRMGGELEYQDDAFGSLGFALLISIILVYLIMVLLYNDYVRPFVVMFSIPLAVIGALLALALTMKSLSIFSMLGLIMLVGLVAKNAIILVDFTAQLQREGLPVKEALLEAIHKRFRPIIMTTVAMIIGMLPIALAQGPGAEWKNSLAWVLIGGLASSMFLTLVVVPLIYYVFDRIMDKLKLNRKKEVVIND